MIDINIGMLLGCKNKRSCPFRAMHVLQNVDRLYQIVLLTSPTCYPAGEVSGQALTKLVERLGSDTDCRLRICVLRRTKLFKGRQSDRHYVN